MIRSWSFNHFSNCQNFWLRSYRLANSTQGKLYEGWICAIFTLKFLHSKSLKSCSEWVLWNEFSGMMSSRGWCSPEFTLNVSLFLVKFPHLQLSNCLILTTSSFRRTWWPLLFKALSSPHMPLLDHGPNSHLNFEAFEHLAFCLTKSEPDLVLPTSSFAISLAGLLMDSLIPFVVEVQCTRMRTSFGLPKTQNELLPLERLWRLQSISNCFIRLIQAISIWLIYIVYII